MKSQRFFTVACASALLLVSASAFAQLTDDERKCSDAFNKAVRNVGNQEQKNNRKACIKNGSGDVSACVNATGAKADEKELKVEGLFASGEKCDPNSSFGVNNLGTPAGNDAGDAAEEGTDDILRDLWGDPVDDVVAEDKCADAVAKRTGKIYDTILKAFRKCAKDAASIANIGTLEACVATAAADAKVVNFGLKLGNDVLNKCSASPPIVAGTDDGECGSAANQADFTTCAIGRARCNACLTLNTTTGGNADCSTISGVPCGIPSHKCTFDEATDNSNLGLLAVNNADFGGLVTDIAGAVDISCPPPSDVNGKRACTCDLQTWVPNEISGIGFICITAGPPCPVGEVDCDGGNVLGVAADDDSEIGSCTSHADCASQCDTHCGGLSMIRDRAQCENICQGGSRNGLACICDQVGSSGCVGGTAGVDDCPGGNCPGKNNEVDQSCQCQCIDRANGGASSAGDIQCQLSSDIKVVASLPCSNSALVDLPPACFTLTSQDFSAQTSDTNESGLTITPPLASGTPESCANLDNSITTGYELVSDVGFHDSTIGDIRAALRIDCQ